MFVGKSNICNSSAQIIPHSGFRGGEQGEERDACMHVCNICNSSAQIIPHSGFRVSMFKLAAHSDSLPCAHVKRDAANLSY